MSPMYLEGISDVLGRLRSALEQVPDLTADGVRDAVLDIGARAAEKAPVDTGALRGSMTTDAVVINDEVIGEVRFTEQYAAVQHERVDFKHPQGGEAKYLEKAAIEKTEMVRAKAAAALNDLFGGG